MKVKIDFAFDLSNHKIKFVDTALMQPSRFFHHQYLIRLIDEARLDTMGWSPTDLTVNQFNEIFDSEFDWGQMKLLPKEFEYDGSLGFAQEVGIYVIENDYKGIHPGISKVLAAETNDEKYDAFVEEFANYRSEQIPELDTTIFSDPLLVARLDRWVNEKAASETQTKDYVFNIGSDGVFFTKKELRLNDVPSDLAEIDFGEDLVFLIPGDILVDMGGAPVHVYGVSFESGALGIKAHDDGFDYNTVKQPLIDAGFEFDDKFEFGELTTQQSVIDKLFNEFQQTKIQQAQMAAGPTPTTQQVDQAVKDVLNGISADIDLTQGGLTAPIGQVDQAVKDTISSIGMPVQDISLSDDDQIVKAIKSGRSLRDIGREFGIGHQKVAKIGEGAGVYTPKKKAAADVTPEIAELPDDDLDALAALYAR